MVDRSIGHRAFAYSSSGDIARAGGAASDRYGCAGKDTDQKAGKKEACEVVKEKEIIQKSYKLAYEGMEGKKYTFQYYQDMGTHTATINWYYVHKSTGKITSMF